MQVNEKKQGLLTEENSRTRGGNMAGLLFWKKKCLETGTEEAQREFLSDRKV